MITYLLFRSSTDTSALFPSPLLRGNNNDFPESMIPSSRDHIIIIVPSFGTYFILPFFWISFVSKNSNIIVLQVSNYDYYSRYKLFLNYMPYITDNIIINYYY